MARRHGGAALPSQQQCVMEVIHLIVGQEAETQELEVRL